MGSHSQIADIEISPEMAEKAIFGIDYILDSLAFGFLVEKGDESLSSGGMTPGKVIELEGNLSSLLQKAATKVNKPLKKKLLKLLIDKDWADLDDDGREMIYKLAADHLKAAGVEAASRTGSIIHNEAEKVYTGVRKYFDKRFKLSSNLEYIDNKLINTFARDNNYWIGKHYAESHLETLKRIGEKALEEGLGRDELAKHFKQALGDQFEDYRYWDVVSSSVINRSRSYSTIRSFHVAGIEEYEWYAQGDERQCPICGELNGTILNVKIAYETIERNAELENPEDLKFETPWLSTDKDGAAYYKNRDGSRTNVDLNNGKELQKAGISMPQAHGKCRCDIVISLREERKIVEDTKEVEPKAGKWTEVKNIKDAKKQLELDISIEKGVSKANALQVINSVGSEKAKLIKKYPKLQGVKISELEIADKRLGKRGAIGTWNSQSKKMSIHRGSASKVAIERNIKRAKSDHFSMTNDTAENVFRHEYGHVIMDQLISEKQSFAIRDEWLNVMDVSEDKIARQVTKYATTDPDEAFSEMFAIMTSGKKIKMDVLPKMKSAIGILN